MRDVEQQHALGLEPPQQAVDGLDIGARQGRGRLVEDQQPGLAVERLADLDQLPARQRQVADRQAGIDVGAADALQNVPRGLVLPARRDETRAAPVAA